MVGPSLHLSLLDNEFSICRLAPDAPAPTWALSGSFVSLTRTDEELSVVTLSRSIPPDVHAEHGWRCLKVAGPLDFALTGILAALCTPLAAARVPLFAISTYDTDYLLVRSTDLDRAIAGLKSAGHEVLLGTLSQRT